MALGNIPALKHVFRVSQQRILHACVATVILTVIYLAVTKGGVRGASSSNLFSNLLSDATDPQHLSPGSGAGREHTRDTWWRDVLCGPTPAASPDTTADTITLLQLQRDTTPLKRDNNVFLIDIDCKGSPLFRSWCAVESWASQNPTMSVWFVLTSLTADDSDGLPRRLLSRYANLQVVGVNLDDIFNGTPLHDFFASKNWTIGSPKSWWKNTISNMLRLVLVWQWGGFYSDTDVICITNMANFTNTVGFYAPSGVNNAIFNFKHHHKFLEQFIEELPHNFKGKTWGSIGPNALTEMFKRHCGVKDLSQLHSKVPVTCGDITLVPELNFYLIDYRNHAHFLRPELGKKFSKDFKASNTIHFWNKLTQNLPVKVKTESIMEVAARMYCPVTFLHATRRSRFF